MMQAALFHAPKKLLTIETVPIPTPKPGELLLKVEACGVCRTDLHILDGELLPPRAPLILGHQIVGRTETGRRVGGAWLFASCGECLFCKRGEENLCPHAEFTGFTKAGGFAEYVVLQEAFTYPLPEGDATLLAPLLCAGLIGWRALKKCGNAETIGFYGFGSSAHLLIQIAPSLNKRIFAFTRPNDREKQKFALSFGAEWAGGSNELPPTPLDAAIILASEGALIPAALKAVRPGGVVVTAGIEMTAIPSFPYSDLWMERKIESVANLTREDGKSFLAYAKKHPVIPEVTCFPLAKINEAVTAIREPRFKGSAVIRIF